MSLSYDPRELFDAVGAKLREDTETAVHGALLSDLLRRVKALEARDTTPAVVVSPEAVQPPVVPAEQNEQQGA